MKKGRVILTAERFQLTLQRLCHQLIENYPSFNDVCFVGIQERGVLLADRLLTELQGIRKDAKPTYGKLDITFYRDDFRRRDQPLKASPTEMNFLIEGKHVIIIDDVLYTGRTVQAALTALQHYGRPQKVELLSLVDRRFNRHLPIQSDYTGITVDALDEAYVKVEWQAHDGADRILLFSPKTTIASS